MGMSVMATCENVIIGAGPYGLSIAAHLRAANIAFEIIGSTMESWRRHMPRGMYLKSEAFASNLSDPERRLTYERFCAEHGRPYRRKDVPLPIADFLDYADWFRGQGGGPSRDATVTVLRPIKSGFELALDDGDVVIARRVIVATGHLHYRHVPTVLAGLGGFVSHSSEHHDLSRFAGWSVTVVGCGQSGLETAALLHELGADVRVVARPSQIRWNERSASESLFGRLRYPEAGLGRGWRSVTYSEWPRAFSWLPARHRERIVATVLGPAGSWWLKDRIIGQVRLLTGCEINTAAEHRGRLRLSVLSGGGAIYMDTDHVIAATGYKVDIGRLAFLDPALLSRIEVFHGAPALDSVFQSSVRNLHFVGIASAFTFGPVMRFVHGTKHAAAILTAHLRAGTRRRPQIANVRKRPVSDVLVGR
jgi:FAD-dependent urate hydroxylase